VSPEFKMKKSNSRVFFLLGAGSSMPYFPSTLELTKALTSTKLIDISSFVELKDKTYFGYLADISSQIWGRALNFEELIHLSILFSNLSKSQFDTIKQIPKPFMKLATKIKDEFLKFDDELESKWASQLACDFILDEIRNYSDKNKNKLSSSSLNSALNILDQQGYILDIFSLNYDNLVDYSKVNFETGFDKDRTTTNYKVFKPEKFYSHELSHVYCQMHGSILFNTRGIQIDSHSKLYDLIRIKKLKTIQKYLRKTVFTLIYL
jgi:hypothetical protein